MLNFSWQRIEMRTNALFYETMRSASSFLLGHLFCTASSSGFVPFPPGSYPCFPGFFFLILSSVGLGAHLGSLDQSTPKSSSPSHLPKQYSMHSSGAALPLFGVRTVTAPSHSTWSFLTEASFRHGGWFCVYLWRPGQSHSILNEDI